VTTVSNISHRRDGGGDLGGFIAKDRLWFYGAYNRVDEGRETTIIRARTVPGSPTIDSTVPRTTKRDLYAVKLTGKLSSNHTVVGSVNGDPSKIEGDIFTIAGPESTWKGVRETGSPAFVGRYEGVFGSSLMLRAQAARHKEKDIITGPGSTVPLLLDQTVNPNLRSGGFAGFDQKTFSRDNYNATVTKFAGAHEIKGGIDYEHTKAVDKRFSGGGGQIIYKLIQTSTGTIYYRHRYFVNDRAAGFVRTDPTTWEIAVPLVSEPDSRGTSFFAQDSWKVASGLSVNLGIRWEGQDVRDRDNKSAFTLKQNWAPRIGFIYDFARNNKSKLYANWGRFYENIPMDINIRAFGGELACFCYNFDPSPNAIRPVLPVTATPSRTNLLGSSVEPVDPDLKGQYSDEFLVGMEYELANRFVLGAKVTRRDLGRVIEDFFIPSTGEYFIANPASGIGKEMGFYDFVNSADAPKAKRSSTAFEITANKRFSDSWQFIASAVFSKLEGNYDGLFQASTGQLDPNINSAFDYADFLVNSQGKLSNDRPVQVKLDGSYEFANGGAQGLNLGFSTHWYSGTPLNAYGYSFAYSNWEYYLVPRGSVGRGPSDWEADLHVGYPVKLGGQRRLNLIADVFNLFDRQAITFLDERYNLVQDGHCGGIPEAICNGDGGLATRPVTGTPDKLSLTPLGTIANPRATATNPDYLQKSAATAPDIRPFTGQRSIRIGARFTF
jgi:hypothetical protein